MARSLHQAISKKRGQQNPVALAVLLSFASTFASPGLLLADLSPEFEARLRGSGRVDAALIDRLIKTQDAAIDVIVVYRLSPPIAGREIGDEARGFERRAEIAERREHLLARLASEDFSLRRQFAGVPAMALAVSLEGILALSIDPTVRRIGLDIELEIQLAEAVPLVGLSALHSAGYEGGGIQVATVDTGIDAAHLDLADSLIDEQCFCSGGCCPAGGNTQSGPGAAADDHGHGTRVAGILTSNGMVAPVGGANDAQLVAVKALGSGGGGILSDIVAAIDWIAINRPDVDVLNLSLGGGFYPGECDSDDAATLAFAAAIDPLWANGVLVVAGSGNNGSGVGMLTPACLSHVVSVGAVYDANVGSVTVHGCTDSTTQADQVTCYSNSSPTTDVFAPGGPTTTSTLGGGSTTSHGTSYATPIVAACGAILRQVYPGASTDELAAALTTSPISVVDVTNGLNFPRLDCEAAVISLADAEVPSISPSGLLVLLAAMMSVARTSQQKRAFP